MSLDNTKDQNLDVKFDIARLPCKQVWYLKPVAWALSFPEVWARKCKIKKTNMKGLKHPYVLLCTHAAFLDFKVATKAIFPHGATYVVAVDGFIKREGIMRKVGCISKRKFISDPVLVRHLNYSIKKLKQTVLMYPEARYTIYGTNAVLPESLGKLCKLLKAPVVVLRSHGHYINSSAWNWEKKKTPVESEMTQVLTPEDLQNLSLEEINSRINDAFSYDEYKWQKEKGILVKNKNRANGLQKVLYKCPHCLAEEMILADGCVIACGKCHKSYRYNEDGSMSATEGVTEFDHIPDWCEWERGQVREEILRGEYRIEGRVRVDSLPNSKGLIYLGEGHFVHDADGLKVTFPERGAPKTFVKPVLDNYSCHIEFNFAKRGDAVSFSEGEDTYFFTFLDLKNVIVKVHFGVEELHKLAIEKA